MGATVTAIIGWVKGKGNAKQDSGANEGWEKVLHGEIREYG